MSVHPWEALVSRRDVLRVSSLAVAGSLLPSTVRASGEGPARSVIVLWMAGGVTHLDSFDPKPDAPSEIRGTLGAIATTVPGVRFGEVMPALARQAHRLALVRSFVPATDDHFLAQAFGLSGKRVTLDKLRAEPNVGAVVSRVMGPRAGLPAYLAVPGTTRPGPPPTNLFTGGWLGREYEPFGTGGRARNEDFTARVKEPDEEDFHRQGLDLARETSLARMAGRRSLRERLDRGLGRLEGAAEVLQRQYHGAFEMLLSPGVRAAFDLRQEPGRLRERYGRTKIGLRCLLARRLVEAGARFVLVDYGYDPEFGNLWDNHNAAVQMHPPIVEMVKKDYHLAGTDRACAALLEDLAARGLLDSTLVLFLTEFGRTPRINRDGGRDHWGRAGSIWFAGAGVKGGQVFGATDGHAANVRGLAYSPADVAASVYRAVGMGETELPDRQGRPVPLLTEGKVIAGLW